MNQTTRAKALSWPYPRHRDFEESLQKAASTWFKGKGFATHAHYPYILQQREDWKKNIILPEVAVYIQSEKTRREQMQIGFPLHKYAHHGLSSQAMLFNLVGPLIVRNDLEPLRVAAEGIGLQWPAGNVKASFEVEDRSVFNEDFGQPTSIDLVIENDLGSTTLFIEAKLVERQFGGCSVFSEGDCDGSNPVGDLNTCYLHYIHRHYWTRLAEFGFDEDRLKPSPICILSQHYQFFREVLFALAKGGSFVLLHDNRNPTFFRGGGGNATRGLLPFLTSMVPEAKRDRVKSVTMQQVVQAIKDSARHDDWIVDFEHKYGLA